MALAATSRRPPIRDSRVANPELPHLLGDVDRVVDLLSEYHRAFGKFSSVTSRRYFIPSVRGYASLPEPLRRAIARLGLMIVIVARK